MFVKIHLNDVPVFIRKIVIPLQNKLRTTLCRVARNLRFGLKSLRGQEWPISALFGDCLKVFVIQETCNGANKSQR